jgi:hypothetical protein
VEVEVEVLVEWQQPVAAVLAEQMVEQLMTRQSASPRHGRVKEEQLVQQGLLALRFVRVVAPLEREVAAAVFFRELVVWELSNLVTYYHINKMVQVHRVVEEEEAQRPASRRGLEAPEDQVMQQEILQLHIQVVEVVEVADGEQQEVLLLQFREVLVVPQVFFQLILVAPEVTQLHLMAKQSHGSVDAQLEFMGV